RPGPESVSHGTRRALLDEWNPVALGNGPEGRHATDPLPVDEQEDGVSPSLVRLEVADPWNGRRERRLRRIARRPQPGRDARECYGLARGTRPGRGQAESRDEAAGDGGKRSGARRERHAHHDG